MEFTDSFPKIKGEDLRGAVWNHTWHFLSKLSVPSSLLLEVNYNVLINLKRIVEPTYSAYRPDIIVEAS